MRLPVAVALAVLLAALLLPGTVVGQEGQGRSSILDPEGEKWQLLAYREGDGMTLVPPGYIADIILWVNVVDGNSGCGRFTSSYRIAPDLLRIDPPEVQARPCDAEAERLDELYFSYLAETRTWATEAADGSQLELQDAIGQTLLAFTSASVPDDPTIAPWRLARVTDAQGTVGPVIPGSDPVATFLPGGRLVGDTGCGSFLGSWETNDTRVVITQLASRLEGCTPELRAQAELIVATLPEVSDFSVSPAGLSLADPAGLTRLAWVPDIALGGRNWTPLEVLDEDGEVVLASDRLENASVRFTDESVDGRTMCRGYAGQNVRSGLALTIFDLATPRGFCRPKDAEGAFLGALGEVASHALRGSQLELLDKGGNPLLRLVPQPDLLGVRWELTRMDAAPAGSRGRMQEPLAAVRPPTATFVNGERILVGDTGVNPFNAIYETAGPTLTIRDARSTGQDCQTRRRQRRPVCRQEAIFLERLTEVTGYLVQAERLRLLRGNRPVLEFQPARRDGEGPSAPRPTPSPTPTASPAP